MHSADFVKFNDEEILEITAAMGSSFTTLKDNMNFIAQKTNITAMCVTRGKDGALLMWEGRFYENSGYPVQVADTVGAGDSFLAALITSLLSGKDPQTAIDFSCAVGALVAEAPGANPEISNSRIEGLMIS
jgi:fructokinase